MAKILERRQLTVRIPNEVYEDLQVITDALKISMTDFTASIIVDALAKKSAEITRLKELQAGEQQRQLEMQKRAAEIWGSASVEETPATETFTESSATESAQKKSADTTRD